MDSFDIYVFILCFIVFASLTALFSFLIYSLIKLTERLVRAGAEDERITDEYNSMQKKKTGCLSGVVDRVVSILLCCILFAFFIFSMYVNFSGAPVSDSVPTLSVVQSSSMSYKNEKNTYLNYYGLDDQFQTFDLVLLYKLPPVEELELYDIVSYDINGVPVIHRIVGIEPPSEKHSEYYFLLQGDALESPDRFPVYYSQMRGIYRGEHIPFVGSFVTFMQSVAGYLCILLVIFGMVAIPLVEKRVNAVKRERLIEIGVIPSEDAKPEAEWEVEMEAEAEVEAETDVETEDEAAPVTVATGDGEQ